MRDLERVRQFACIKLASRTDSKELNQSSKIELEKLKDASLLKVARGVLYTIRGLIVRVFVEQRLSIKLYLT